jgi:hypothetical protein
LTATRDSPNSDDNNGFPEIDELLSCIRQKSMLASAGPNGYDDDGFIDIDKLLSGIQQKNVPARTDLNSGSIAKMVNNRTRGSSLTDSSCSMARSSQGEYTAFLTLTRASYLYDPRSIILSDDESAGAESETDCSNLDVDVRAKSDSDSLHVADSELVDGDGFGSGAALISDGLVTDHQDNHNNHNNGVVDKT